MEDGLLLLNGDLSIDCIPLKKYKLIVCADGAYDFALQHNIQVDYVIGDLDSIACKNITVPTIKYCSEKDETDGQLALMFLIDKGCYNIDIVGAIGKRVDHTLTNINLLDFADKNNVKATILTKNEIITLIYGKVCQATNIGATISLLPFSDSAHILQSQGLKYSVDDIILTKSCSLGMSNVAILSQFSFDVVEGKVLMCINLNNNI